MINNNRCLYCGSFNCFLSETDSSILGKLFDGYHGEARTTTIEAWKEEIVIMKNTLSALSESDGQIVMEHTST